MRKVKSTEQIRVIEHVEAIYCDKCGKRIDTIKYSRYDYDWFKVKFGYGTEESGESKKYVMELCERCSKNLLDKFHHITYFIFN